MKIVIYNDLYWVVTSLSTSMSAIMNWDTNTYSNKLWENPAQK